MNVIRSKTEKLEDPSETWKRCIEKKRRKQVDVERIRTEMKNRVLEALNRAKKILSFCVQTNRH